VIFREGSDLGEPPDLHEHMRDVKSSRNPNRDPDGTHGGRQQRRTTSWCHNQTKYMEHFLSTQLPRGFLLYCTHAAFSLIYIFSPPSPTPRLHILLLHINMLCSRSLVSAVALLLLDGLLEPVLLHGRRAGLGLALDLGHLALVGLELAGNVGLLGGRGSGGDAELLHVALGVGGLEGGRFVGFQLLEVQVLDDVGWVCVLVDLKLLEGRFGWERCVMLYTLDDGGDGEGAAQGCGVLLAGDTGERLALGEEVVSLLARV
jgi:hypothetical protein